MISDSKSNQQSPAIQIPVYLNVYNFWPCFNKICQPFGIGVYHTGVQFYDDQYMFFGFDGDETGVGYIEPFQAAYQFKEQIVLGYSPLTFFEFDQQVLDPLRMEFIGNKYDLLANNCNHFARRLTHQLKVSQKFPKIVFRVTDFCNLLRCCIPQCILNGRLDWFDWSSTSQKQSLGYHELQQSVKEQIDMKILSQQKKHHQHRLPIFKDIEPTGKGKRIDYNAPPTSFEQERQKSMRITYTEPSYEALKKTTLPKGILPHLENAHERASMKELPNVSPRSLGKESIFFQQSKQTSPEAHKKYPNQNASIFASKKNNQQKYFQS